MFNISTTVNGICFCGASISTVISDGKAEAICPACGSRYPIVIDKSGLRVEGGKVSDQAIAQKAIVDACSGLGISPSRVIIKTGTMERNVTLSELAGSLLGSFDTAKKAADAFVNAES